MHGERTSLCGVKTQYEWVAGFNQGRSEDPNLGWTKIWPPKSLPWSPLTYKFAADATGFDPPPPHITKLPFATFPGGNRNEHAIPLCAGLRHMRKSTNTLWCLCCSKRRFEGSSEKLVACVAATISAEMLRCMHQCYACRSAAMIYAATLRCMW